MKRQTPPSDHPKAKASRTTASRDEGSTTASCSPSFGDRGVTVRGLRALVAGSGGRSVHEMWRDVWIHETVAAGWTVNVTYESDGTWASQVYRHIETGATLEKDSLRVGAPEGCLSVLESRVDLAAEMGMPTHFVSYPWQMCFEDIVEAVEAVLNPDDVVYSTRSRETTTRREICKTMPQSRAWRQGRRRSCRCALAGTIRRGSSGCG